MKTKNKTYISKLLYKIGDGEARELHKEKEIIVPSKSYISFDIGSGGCWYGHGFSHRQPYPLNNEPIVNESFAVNNIQSPIWMCSAGYAILAETTSNLSVSCSKEGNGILKIICTDRPVTFKVFQGGNLQIAHKKLMAYIGWPGKLPERSFFGDSVFCTWTQYPRCITQERVIDMANTIREQGYPCSIITIDDIWESAYGELKFSKDFPNPPEMVRVLHNLGFKVVLWVTPFINKEAGTYDYLADKGFLVKRIDSAEPSLLQWWGGTAGLIDLTNPDAREWYKQQLLHIKGTTGIDGFKIDGGDAKYQPSYQNSSWYGYKGPSGFVDELLSVFEEVAPGMCESRTAWLSQKRNIIWREGGKDSHWGIDNGLCALVNLGLHMSLLGYDLFMPDMIPGRVQTMTAAMPLPSDELFVRWTEVSTFMPVMQFSYYPWNYNTGTASIIKLYALLHKVIGEYVYEKAKERQAPLLKPLWYEYPGVKEFYTVSDEFLLGEDILIAPVIKENQVARDIMLPDGLWIDAWTGKSYEEKLLIQYPAPCPGIPVFIRAANRELFEKVHQELGKIPRGTIHSGFTSSDYRAGIERNLSVTG